jgi:hypothetical protein
VPDARRQVQVSGVKRLCGAEVEVVGSMMIHGGRLTMPAGGNMDMSRRRMQVTSQILLQVQLSLMTTMMMMKMTKSIQVSPWVLRSGTLRLCEVQPRGLVSQAKVVVGVSVVMRQFWGVE